MTSEDGVGARAARLHRLDGAAHLVEVFDGLIEGARDLSQEPALESMTLHKSLGLVPPRIDSQTVRASVASNLR